MVVCSCTLAPAEDGPSPTQSLRRQSTGSHSGDSIPPGQFLGVSPPPTLKEEDVDSNSSQPIPSENAELNATDCEGSHTASVASSRPKLSATGSSAGAEAPFAAEERAAELVLVLEDCLKRSKDVLELAQHALSSESPKSSPSSGRKILDSPAVKLFSAAGGLSARLQHSLELAKQQGSGS